MEQEIKKFREKKAQAEQGGGEKAIAAQHQKGKLTARERIAALLDPGESRRRLIQAFSFLSGKREPRPHRRVGKPARTRSGGMAIFRSSLIAFLLSACWLCSVALGQEAKKSAIRLPAPPSQGKLSVEEAIRARRTARQFSDQPLTLLELSALLWAGQGLTEPGGNKRAAPSAGALYPLELFAAVKANGVKNLPAGLYQYQPQGHQLLARSNQDLSRPIAAAALGQDWMAQAPVCLLITGDYSRTARKYRGRAERYVHFEAGHAAENILLEVQSLKLKAGIVGAFRDEELKRLLALPPSLTPLLILPVGRE